MPLARRKKVLITKEDDALLHASPETPVFYIAQTGEIFQDYVSYVERLAFYRLRIFQCEVTGKGNLTFFEALESERIETRMLQSRFPEQLKPPVLKSVQWQLVGRLDHVVDAVFERFKDRYFEGERIFVDSTNTPQGVDLKDQPSSRYRYWGRIVKVYPPPKSKAINGKVNDAHNGAGVKEEKSGIHEIYGDLKIPVPKVNALDDPRAYLYDVQLGDENGPSTGPPEQTPGTESVNNGAVMTVRSDVMSRDRLAFSKSLLKRFVRDCVDRDASVGSPWIVKETVALKYNIDPAMPDKLRSDIEAIKRSEVEKRKRVTEVKDLPLPANKRVKKKAPLTEEELRAKEKAIELARIKRLKDEESRQNLTGCKRVVSRWPIEDMDVILTKKERENGKLIKRPTPHRVSEFAAPEMFELFLMSWSFLTTFGHAINLAPFTMDILEAALQHTTPDPCAVVDCMHTSLISSCRSIAPGAKSQLAIISLLESDGESPDETDVSVAELCNALVAFGSGWEKKAVNRETWPNALVSILKEHATLDAVPPLRNILSHLLFEPDNIDGEVTDNRTWTPARPRERYHSLPFDLKISVLYFLCNFASASKAIHQALENCEASLTEMRKEKVEYKRQHKKILDQIAGLDPEKRKSGPNKKTAKSSSVAQVKGTETTNGDINLESNNSDPEVDQSVATEPPLSGDLASDINPGTPERSSALLDEMVVPGKSSMRTPRSSLRFKAQTQAKIIETVKEKIPLTKKDEADLKRLESEATSFGAHLETLELEFRQYMQVSRLKPLGKDRFYCRVWWFDGVGCMTLTGEGGLPSYGIGKLYLQGPSEDDLDIMARKAEEDPTTAQRRDIEEGDGLLGPGEWAWYSTPEELDAYISWLNVKGVREHALEKVLTRWKKYIVSCMNQRIASSDSGNQSETRRARKGSESREPYLQYINSYARDY